MKSDAAQIGIKIVFLVLMGLIVLSAPVLFLIFFVPIIGWFVWSDHDKIAELEKRIAALEGQKKPEQG